MPRVANSYSKEFWSLRDRSQYKDYSFYGHRLVDLLELLPFSKTPSWLPSPSMSSNPPKDTHIINQYVIINNE
jgi:hypothetical protein